MVEGARLRVLGGGLTAEDAEREWLAAWARIAEAFEAGVRSLHPAHPRREDLLLMAVNARLTAELPPSVHLRPA